MAINRVEFANFLCHFGQEVMLDKLEEIVLPAFTDDVLIRNRGRNKNAEYFFYEVTLEKFHDAKGNVIIGVYGEFIKNVRLTRTQIFEPSKGLIQDTKSIRSSPSASFLLILNNHKLIYFPRTPHAPSLKEFESTTQNFLDAKREQYIDALYKSSKGTPQKTTKKALRALHPWPTLRVVPLSNTGSVSDFIAKFGVLKSIDFQLLRPNPAIDASETFKEMRGVLGTLNAENAKITASNNKDGLDKAKAVTVIAEATKGGNQSVKLKGNDLGGATLAGSNEDFKVSVPLDSIPITPKETAKKLFKTYKDTITDSIEIESSVNQAKLNSLGKKI